MLKTLYVFGAGAGGSCRLSLPWSLDIVLAFPIIVL